MSRTGLEIPDELRPAIRTEQVVLTERWDEPRYRGKRVLLDTGNGWGVSVVQWSKESGDPSLEASRLSWSESYGGRDGLWEAALTLGEAGGYKVAHATMRARWGDVKGWLTPAQVGALIDTVAGYKPPRTLGREA